MPASTLLTELEAHEDDLRAVRHDIHRHPETGCTESRTAALVARKLRE